MLFAVDVWIDRLSYFCRKENIVLHCPFKFIPPECGCLLATIHRKTPPYPLHRLAEMNEEHSLDVKKITLFSQS